MRHSKQSGFQGILNFRDLGGYRTSSGRCLAWRRVFRSGELSYATPADLSRLKQKIKLATILDLTSPGGLVPGKGRRPDMEGFQYFNAPFITGDIDDTAIKTALRESTNLGEVYLFEVRHQEYGRSIVRALEIIADRGNHPLVFHCSAGKDRTGVLAAILLGTLGVADEDIARDYSLSAAYMKRHIARLSEDPQIAQSLQALPAFIHKAAPDSIARFLSGLRQDYGSAWGYVTAQGADPTLQERLEKALLV
jgi:protein-tyrosine phosphatase